MVSVAFVIDCHDREVLAFSGAPRSLNGADIRTLMERSLWKRFRRVGTQDAASGAVAF